MIYRDFGRTGFRISALGFGAMRLPIAPQADATATADLGEAVELLRYGIDRGINYIDTAYFYCGYRSELAVGLALENGWRDKVKLSTKLPLGEVKKPDDFKRLLDEQLRKLRTDRIDFYHFHALSKAGFDEIVMPFKLIDLAEKFKSEGVIGNLSFSFHDPDPAAMLGIIDTGAFASVLCQYNLLDRSNVAGIRHAHERGLGVVIMGPVGGGRLAFKGGVFEDAIDGKMTTPELAVRFVLSSYGVDCALSGMENRAMVDSNVRVASMAGVLSPTELAAIDRVAAECAKLRDLYCTGCGYCVKECPHEVNVPRCFEALIYDKVYHFGDAAKLRYSEIGASEWVPGKTASACVRCGKCEPHCPQRIPIRERLKECVTVFGR